VIALIDRLAGFLYPDILRSALEIKRTHGGVTVASAE